MLSSTNILRYQKTNAHKLSFDLLVDEKPIAEFANSAATSIPSRLFKNGGSVRISVVIPTSSGVTEAMPTAG